MSAVSGLRGRCSGNVGKRGGIVKIEAMRVSALPSYRGVLQRHGGVARELGEIGLDRAIAIPLGMLPGMAPPRWDGLLSCLGKPLSGN